MKQRKRHLYKDDLPSMTQQSAKKECDVNSIMEKYRKTGTISHVMNRSPINGDVSQMGDFRTNLQKVQEGIDLFNQLPAIVRKKLNNDPANLPQYLKENADEARKLGLLEPKRGQETGGDQHAPKNDDQTTKTGAANPTPSQTPQSAQKP